MCFDQGANLQTQAWMVKRLLSTFNRAACRPRRPRSWVLLRLMHPAGIPVPHPPVRESRCGSHDGDEGDGSTDESSNSDDDDDGDEGIQSGPHQCQNRNQSFRSRQSEGYATVSGSVRSPTAFLTSPRERKEAPASSSSASSHENSNWQFNYSFLLGISQGFGCSQVESWLDLGLCQYEDSKGVKRFVGLKGNLKKSGWGPISCLI